MNSELGNSHQTSTKIKKIAVVTATRAEFGLLSRLLHLLDRSSQCELQLFVTGSHLLKSQGHTVDEITQQGLAITQQIPILQDSSAETDLTEVTAQALSLFGKAFKHYQPDAVLVLGDRYELLGICSAALLSHIPIVHLHGGETTEGAMDEAIRHAVTKMASLHFVAAEPYAQRVIQMGEQPNRVFNVGAPGLDVIRQLQPLSKAELAEFVQMPLNSPLFAVTYHPVTWGTDAGIQALHNLFNALECFPQASLIWTAANTDEAGNEINALAQQWINNRSNGCFVKSLGSLRYLSLLSHAQVVIGNSSSGIIEAPLSGTATVNIGNRQAGRLRAPSIIDCNEGQKDIEQAIEQALSSEHQKMCQQKQSCYGQGDTAQKIKQILLQYDFSDLQNKVFYDLN